MCVSPDTLLLMLNRIRTRAVLETLKILFVHHTVITVLLSSGLELHDSALEYLFVLYLESIVIKPVDSNDDDTHHQ
jgi:hypothetical protein